MLMWRSPQLWRIIDRVSSIFSATFRNLELSTEAAKKNDFIEDIWPVVVQEAGGLMWYFGPKRVCHEIEELGKRPCQRDGRWSSVMIFDRGFGDTDGLW
jgi:hypothetical protein